MASEPRERGGQVKELRDGIEIEGAVGSSSSPLHEAEIDPWGDHRVAMAFAVAGLVVPGIVIRHPQVVEKSYPEFFGALQSQGVGVEFLENSGRKSG